MIRHKIDNEMKILQVRHMDNDAGDYYKDGRFSMICDEHKKPMGAKDRAIIYYCFDCDKAICVDVEDEPSFVELPMEKKNDQQ